MASKMSEVEFNSELKTVYENIKSSNPSTLATLKSTNESELSTLETKIKGYLDSLTSADTWKDDVSAKIKTASETFTSLIEKCKEPGGSVLTATQGAVTSLQTGLEDYDNKLEELNAKIRSYNKKVDQEPSPRYTTDDQGHQTTTETDAYKTWTSELTALSEIIQHMNDELEELESMCKALIEQIKGLLSALDSEASNAALKLGIEITKQWLPDAGDIDERFKNGGYEVTGTETHDKDGKLVKRTYTVYDRIIEMEFQLLKKKLQLLQLKRQLQQLLNHLQLYRQQLLNHQLHLQQQQNHQRLCLQQLQRNKFKQ